MDCGSSYRAVKGSLSIVNRIRSECSAWSPRGTFDWIVFPASALPRLEHVSLSRIGRPKAFGVSARRKRHRKHATKPVFESPHKSLGFKKVTNSLMVICVLAGSGEKRSLPVPIPESQAMNGVWKWKHAKRERSSMSEQRSTQHQRL